MSQLLETFVIESKLSSMTIIIICAVVGGILYFFVLNKYSKLLNIYLIEKLV